MSFGGIFKNENGITVIDENFSNFSIYSKGSALTNSGRISIPIGIDFRLFIKSNSSFYLGGLVQPTAEPTGEMAILGFSKALDITILNHVDFAFDYILMLKSEDVLEDTSISHGFQVFKPDALPNKKLAFSSRQQSMQIIAFFKKLYSVSNQNYVMPAPTIGHEIYIDAAFLGNYGLFFGLEILGPGRLVYERVYGVRMVGNILETISTTLTHAYVPGTIVSTTEYIYSHDLSLLLAQIKT